MAAIDEQLPTLVRGLRGHARASHLCGACGVLLAEDRSCAEHAHAPALPLARWPRVASDRFEDGRQLLPKWKLAGRTYGTLILLLTGALALVKGLEDEDGPKLALAALALLGWVVPSFCPAAIRWRHELRARAAPAPPSKPTLRGTLVCSDKEQPALAYRVVVDDATKLTPDDAWLAPCVLALDDGRELELAGGPVRLRGGPGEPVTRETVAALCEMWGCRAARAGGRAWLLRAGDRVALDGVPVERPPERGYRGAPRYTVEGVPTLMRLDADDS